MNWYTNHITKERIMAFSISSSEEGGENKVGGMDSTSGFWCGERDSETCAEVSALEASVVGADENELAGWLLAVERGGGRCEWVVSSLLGVKDGEGLVMILDGGGGGEIHTLVVV